MVDIIITLLLGALIGWLAGRIFKGKGNGWLLNIIVGIVGSWLGGWLFTDVLGIAFLGELGRFIISVIGAIILLWLIHLIRK